MTFMSITDYEANTFSLFFKPRKDGRFKHCLPMGEHQYSPQ